MLQHENPKKSQGFLFLYSELVAFKFRLHSSPGICIITLSFYEAVVCSKMCFLALAMPPTGCIAFDVSFDLTLQVLLPLSQVKSDFRCPSTTAVL